MSAEVTLLPCPFCGSDEVSHGWQSPGIVGSNSTGTAECHNCGAFVFAEDEADAIAAWNTRQSATAPLEAQIAELTALVQQMRKALEPFVSGEAHTMVFLRSREKMHPAGQDLYREDVERARTALTAADEYLKGEG